MRYLITAAVIAGILATACTAATPSSTTPQTVTKTETSAPIAADTQVPASPVDTTPSYTVSQQNAIRSAQEYLSSQAFSYTGLISQLSSKYGEGFAKADAVFAVNHIQVNWN